MHVLSVKLTFHVAFANSLKDKRKISRSLIQKTKQRFNVSIAEIDTLDIHRTLTLGIAMVSKVASHVQNSVDEVIRFFELNEEAELRDVEYF